VTAGTEATHSADVSRASTRENPTCSCGVPRETLRIGAAFYASPVPSVQDPNERVLECLFLLGFLGFAFWCVFISHSHKIAIQEAFWLGKRGSDAEESRAELTSQAPIPTMDDTNRAYALCALDTHGGPSAAVEKGARFRLHESDCRGVSTCAILSRAGKIQRARCMPSRQPLVQSAARLNFPKRILDLFYISPAQACDGLRIL
jgi:hypothetical protein